MEDISRWVGPENGCILAGVRGSIAHGMYIPPSDPDSIDDEDYMSVHIASDVYYLGLHGWGSRGTIEVFDGRIDLVQYELKKYVSLLIQGNPNVLSLLWLKSKHYVVITQFGRELIDLREKFLSRRMVASFLGYGFGQLQKMGKFNSRGFRGEKRAELITRYGYDTKNAAHCVRLLRMCREYLRDREFNVDRTGIDADELLAIKTGGWSQDKVIDEARKLRADMENLLAAATWLRDSPAQDEIERWLIWAIRRQLKLTKPKEEEK